MKAFLNKRISTIVTTFAVLFLAGSVFFFDAPTANAAFPGAASYRPCMVMSAWGFTVPVPDYKCVIGTTIYNFVWGILGIQVYNAALFFENALDLTMKFSKFVAGVSGIRVAWSVIRDFMNISFIFLLLYAAIRMILGLGKHEAVIKGVITAGLLINFSFFFTSIIIDVSHVFVTEIHQAIVSIGTRRPPTNSTTLQAYGISAVFMEGLGMPTRPPRELFDVPGKYESALIQQMVFQSISYLVVAFIFYAMGFLLIVRFLILVMLLITSPISVMHGFFPQLTAMSNNWWDRLIGQALWAPIMLLFLLITAVIIRSPGFSVSFFSMTP